MSQEAGKVLKLREGYKMTSRNIQYTVTKLLGDDGFGAVFLVKTKKGNECAMKVERKQPEKKPKLTMEALILDKFGGQLHFTKLFDFGVNDVDRFYYVIMERVGKSLSDLKKARKDRVFSFGTGVGVARQCLEAVEELHKNGFIHRDLKPANYACGLNDRSHIVYILDFGIARKYLNGDGYLFPPRENLPFKGTLPFASLACHNSVEQGPKDDCESWFYLLIDLIHPKGLPWRHMRRVDIVMDLKVQSRDKEVSPLFNDMEDKTELKRILWYIDSRQQADKINYQFIYSLLADACNSAGLNINAPYDWENSEENRSKESSRSK